MIERSAASSPVTAPPGGSAMPQPSNRQPLAINCDMGESFGLYKMGDDEGMMPYITIANVACGGHCSHSTARVAGGGAGQDDHGQLALVFALVKAAEALAHVGVRS